MIARHLVVVALMAAWAVPNQAFMPAPTTTRTTTRPSAVTSLYTSTTTTTSTTDALSSAQELSPEFAAALQSIEDQVSSVMPESKKAMLPLLVHFAKEYLGACQVGLQKAMSFDASKDESTTTISDLEQTLMESKLEACRPDVTAKRFLWGLQLSLQFGMGPNQFQFQPFHQALRGAEEEGTGGINFFDFGTEFFRPCVDPLRSTVLGVDVLDQMKQQMADGHNVIILANHQSEGDPQAVTCCLETIGYHDDFDTMTFVAGHKVTTDALAIPFSMGRNLICINSKKHIDSDPATKPLKQQQNLKAMSALLEQLKRGKQLIWLAPSGGRDRRNVETNQVPIAPFDSKTIDMFRLMGRKSKVPTHLYTMALSSYYLCPPPDTVEAGVGEARNVRYVPIGMAMGQELTGANEMDRESFCKKAQDQCQADYTQLLQVLEESA